jgi:hypothetical protein
MDQSENKTEAGVYYDLGYIIGTSGKKYFIQPGKISSARFPEFELRSMTQAFKTNLNGFIQIFDDIDNALLRGELNPVGNAYTVLNITKNAREGLVNKSKFKIAETLEFCALFCNEEGEDVTDLSVEMFERKYLDWCAIPHDAFFLLSVKVKTIYWINYKKVLQDAAAEAAKPRTQYQQ